MNNSFFEDGHPTTDHDHFTLIHTILSYLIVYASGTIAAAAGVGGGAIYTPLFIVLFNLVYEAIPLSKAAVFGCSVAFFAGTLQGTPTKYPGFKHLYAFDVIMIMEPATLLGTVYGVLVSKIFPYWLITLMMTLLLSYTAHKTFRKADQQARKEGEHKDVLESLVGNGNASSNTGYGTITPSIGGTEYRAIECAEYSSWIGWRCMFTVGLCYVTILASSALLDKDLAVKFGFDVECGTAHFWRIIFGATAVCLVLGCWNVYYLVSRRRFFDNRIEEHNKLEDWDRVQFVDMSTSVTWSAYSCLFYFALCILAGFMSSLVGIGGSTIKGPILLHMGLNPTLAKASAQLMLLTTVSSSMFQFFLNGMLPPSYGVQFCLMGACAGMSGKYLIDRYVARNGKQSTIVYMLAIYIVIAAVTMTTVGVAIVLGQLYGEAGGEHQGQLWFRSLCAGALPDMGALDWLVVGGGVHD